MALRTPPSWLQNGSHPAENDRLSMQAIYATSGIIGSGSLLVTQAAVPAMAVQSATGFGAIVGNFQANMGVYQFFNDAPTQLSVTTANPTNPRIDRVVVTINDSFYSGATNNVTYTVVAGTPSGSPVAPAIPTNSLSLATILVGTAVTSIVNANITDTRGFVTTNLPVGDLTEVAAGTGITVSSGTGPIPSVALTTPVAVANGGTGISSFGAGVATFLGTPSSANLAGALTDETGSGSNVFATSPTLVTPVLGVATGTSFNSITGLSAVVGTNLGTAAVGVGTTTARADHVHPTTGLGLTASGLNQFAATTSAQLAGVISDETGSGSLVFATSPTITTPIINNAVLKSPEERCTVSATASTGTIAFNTQTQGVLLHTLNATANFTLNFTNVNANLAVGDSISAVFLNTNGASAFFANAFQIDSVAVTPKFSGGTAPTAGNINSIDAYSFVIIKTAATPTYTVLAGGATKFA